MSFGYILTLGSLLVLVTASVLPADHKTDSLSDHGHFRGGEHDPEYDHDAFVGKDKAAAFKELTPEESKERLSKLIQVIDKNADDAITEEELKDHIDFMQKRYVLNDVEKNWKSYAEEKTKDGVLKWEDYREIVYGDWTAEDMTEEYTKLIRRDERRWKKAADESGEDGALSKDEFACFMHPEYCKHMQEIVVKETIEDMDKDGDGLVELDEYMEDMFRQEDFPQLDGQEPEWLESERELFREERDKDKDGKLDMDEMKEMLLPSGFDHSGAEAKHLIQEADNNKDGMLDEEEIMGHYEAFVGSQATDYGEQLRKHDPAEL